MTAPLIRGDGTPERTWRDFLAQLPGRMRAPGELVSQRRRAVVVAPHPDDELLGIGATLRTLAGLGCATLLVSVTRGEASHPGSGKWTPRALGATRIAERDEGLRRLGWAPDRIVELGLPDGAVAQCEAQLTAALLRILRTSDAVFTTWRHDGHPDHDATGRAVARACAGRRATLHEFPVWMWHWATPGDPRVPWSRLARLSSPPDARLAKQRAVAAHVSQLLPDETTGRGAVLPPSTLGRLDRPFESLLL